MMNLQELRRMILFLLIISFLATGVFLIGFENIYWGVLIGVFSIILFQAYALAAYLSIEELKEIRREREK